MPKFTISEYAERVGVSRAYLYKLEKKGKIDFVLKDKKKSIDSDQADPIVKYKPAHRATTKTYQKNGGKRKGKVEPPKDETLEDESDLPELSENLTTDQLEKIKLFEQAKKLRIDNEIKEGDYYKKDEISEKSFDLFRELRDRMQAIKDRVALKCRASDSDHEARKILGNEIHNILSSIVKNYDDEDQAKKKLLRLLT